MRSGRFRDRHEPLLDPGGGSQFTLYMVCNIMGIVLAAMSLGPWHEHLSWSGMFLMLAALLLVSTVLLQFIRLRHHLTSLNALEDSFAEKVARKALGRDRALPVDLGVPGSVV